MTKLVIRNLSSKVDAAYIVKKLDCSDVSSNNVTVNADQREASVQLPSSMSSEDVHAIVEKLHGSSWHKRNIDVSVMEHASSQSSSHSSSSSNNDASSSSSSSSLSNHAFPASQMQSQHLGSLFAPIDSGVPFTLFGAAPANTASDAFVLPPVQATTVAYLNPDEVYFHDSHPPRFDWASVPIIPFSQVLGDLKRNEFRKTRDRFQDIKSIHRQAVRRLGVATKSTLD